MSVGPQDAQKQYQQIARRIAASIEDGRYAPGDWRNNAGCWV